MQRRCIWSNERGEHLKEITATTLSPFAAHKREQRVWVMPEHEAEFRRFNAYELRYGRLFVGLVLAVIILLVVFVVTGSALGAGLTTIGVGILSLIFPFATPETVQLHGTRKSIQMVRRLAVVGIGIGVLAILLSIT